MTGWSEDAVLHKYVLDDSLTAIQDADRELKSALRRGFLGIDIPDSWEASRDDWGNSNDVLNVEQNNNNFRIEYHGTRRLKCAPVLSVSISVIGKDGAGKSSCNFECYRQIVSEGECGDIVIIGQNQSDQARGGVVLGVRSAIFFHELMSRAGLLILSDAEKYENKEMVSLQQLLHIARKSIGLDKTYCIDGRSMKKYLRLCFRELEANMAPKEFDREFGFMGLRWIPRQWSDWIYR